MLSKSIQPGQVLKVLYANMKRYAFFCKNMFYQYPSKICNFGMFYQYCSKICNFGMFSSVEEVWLIFLQ